MGLSTMRKFEVLVATACLLELTCLRYELLLLLLLFLLQQELK